MFGSLHSALFFYFYPSHHSQSKACQFIIIQKLFLAGFVYLGLTLASFLVLPSRPYLFLSLTIQHQILHFIKNRRHQKNCPLLNFLPQVTILCYFPSNYSYKLSTNTLYFSKKSHNGLLALIKISAYAFSRHYLSWMLHTHHLAPENLFC